MNWPDVIPYYCLFSMLWCLSILLMLSPFVMGGKAPSWLGFLVGAWGGLIVFKGLLISRPIDCFFAMVFGTVVML